MSSLPEVNEIPPSKLNFLWAAGIGTAVTVLGLGVALRSLGKKYPIRPASSYHLTPRAGLSSRFTLPKQLDPSKGEYLYATIKTAPGSHDPADPLSTFVKAFYAHPYFKLEGSAARRWNYASLPRAPGLSLAEVASSLDAVQVTHVNGSEGRGATFVGIFTVLERTEDSALLYWTTPDRLLRGRMDAVAGGTQELAAVRVKDAIEVSYGATHFTLGGGDVKASSADMLRWDMRYLFNSAVRRMERWARAEAKAAAAGKEGAVKA